MARFGVNSVRRQWRVGGRTWSTAALALMALALPLAVSSVLARPAGATTYSVTATVPMNSPRWVAADPTTDTVYVARDDGRVSVINGATNTVTATVVVGFTHGGVAVDPTTHTVYVTNSSLGSVSVIKGATRKVIATVPVGPFPMGVAVDPVTHTVYVASQRNGNSGDGVVSVINGTTNKITATVATGFGLDGVAVDPNTNTVYVTTSLNTVSVINGATNEVTATVTVGEGPTGVAVDPSTDTVYVANEQGRTVSVINGATNKVTATVTDNAMDDLMGVAADPNTDTVYVVNHIGNAVTVIDGATNTVTTTLNVPFDPVGVAVDPITHAAYVTTSENVSVITSVPALAISTTSLTNGTKGAHYSAILAATGGTPPYSWKLVRGVGRPQLPPGLHLNASTGAISGRPTRSGTYVFTVQVTDSNTPTPQTAKQVLSIQIS